MQLFYSVNIKKNLIILDKKESNHCINVLRYQKDDMVNIVDGKGNFYNGKIINTNKGICEISILKKKEKYLEPKHFIHIAISPTKNHDRIEWFIEKAIEIGVSEISFIKCSRTLRSNIRMNRIQKIAITAMKQTLKAYLPKINNMIDFNDFINNNKSMSGYICHLESGRKNKILDQKIIDNKSYVLVGPEGDFVSQEVSYAFKSGVVPVTLGNSRLRTETAGVVACHLLNIKHG